MAIICLATMFPAQETLLGPLLVYPQKFCTDALPAVEASIKVMGHRNSAH